MAHNRQHESNACVGNIIGQNARCGADMYIAIPRKSKIDLVRPNAVDGNEAERWQTLHPTIGKPRSATGNNSTNGAKCRVNRRRVFRLV
ncbi:hypothetical protein D3C80_1677150 [compost metagenome]